MATMLIFVVTCAFQSQLYSGVSGWRYTVGDLAGPEHWHENYSDCGSVMQSPININTSRVLFDPSLRPLNVSEYEITSGVKMELENLGNIAQLYMTGTQLFISGGGLPTRYRLMKIEFHWRSEHLINDQFYPAEIHFIHGQQRLQVSDVVTHPFGQAIVAFFVKLGRKNVNYEPLLTYFRDINVPKKRKTVPTFPINQLLPASDDYHFFRYYGSVTTPPCWETVIWSVAEDVIEISQEQLAMMTQLNNEDEHPLTNTWRPLQNLNHRTILTTNSNYSQTNTATPRFGNGSRVLGSAMELLYLWFLVQLTLQL